MITTELIEKLVNDKLQGREIFLVDILVRKGNRILVSIDSDSAVQIKDCVDLSRYIESNLDREVEDFELEVSSAGLDQPLKHHRQFVKNTGKELIIITAEDKTINAILNGVNQEYLSLQIPENKKLKITSQELTLPLQEIKEAKIAIKINSKSRL